ncbi:MAG: TIGR03936 family radical SAM-associated protein [Planctomycetota bacterium]
MSDTPEQQGRHRYRIRFSKTGLLRWISHRDLARLWERIGRRAELDFSMTEGFHPKPRISFPSALALGVESDDEVVELELRVAMPVAELTRRLVDDRQPGLGIRQVALLPPGFGKAQVQSLEYEILLPADFDFAAVDEWISSLKQRESITCSRKKKMLTFVLADHLLDLSRDQTSVRVCIAARDGASMKVEDLIDQFDAAGRAPSAAQADADPEAEPVSASQDWIARGAVIRRTVVRLEKEFESDDADQTVHDRPANKQRNHSEFQHD